MSDGIACRAGARTCAASCAPTTRATAVVLAGWVASTRDHGGVVFLDLRDREGVVQVVAHPTEAPDAPPRGLGDVKSSPSCACAARCARARPDTVNPNLADRRGRGRRRRHRGAGGLGHAAVPDRGSRRGRRAAPAPLPLPGPAPARDDARPARAAPRARIIRRFFDARGFVDVETPMLTKSTPEGARDFLVPSRLQRGKVYALPQSPQQFKQLLMVAGLDRYYQLARCFRDEDLRADRHWEFTQLDLEMSFADRGGRLRACWRRCSARCGRRSPGSRSPAVAAADLRRGDAAVRVRQARHALRDGAGRPHGGVPRQRLPAFAAGGRRTAASSRAFAAPGAAGVVAARSWTAWSQEATSRGAAGLVWMAVRGDESQSPVSKFLSEDETAAVRESTGAGDGDLVLLVADRPDRVDVALDGLRRLMADRLALVPAGPVGLPVDHRVPHVRVERRRGRSGCAKHHPFTAPLADDLDPATARARAYDIVLNGVELGSGSVRIHDPDLQRRVFDMLGIRAGGGRGEVRPHARGVPATACRPTRGFALGLDRVVMFLTGRDNIRDVIAFPKTSSGHRAADRRAVASRRRSSWTSWGCGSRRRRSPAGRRGATRRAARPPGPARAAGGDRQRERRRRRAGPAIGASIGHLRRPPQDRGRVQVRTAAAHRGRAARSRTTRPVRTHLVQRAASASGGAR